MSFAPMVRTGSDPKFYGNACRFETHAEALAYARDLSARWTAVTDTRVEFSNDPVTYKQVGDNLFVSIPVLGPGQDERFADEGDAS